MSSLSFPWQRIQEKPDNADDVRELIDKVIDVFSDASSQDDVEVKQSDVYLEAFIKKFQLEKWFPEVVFLKDDKKASKAKDKILKENEQRTIMKELEMFQLDDNHCLLEKQFAYSISIYLYIFYWATFNYKRLVDKKSVKKIVILDIMISLNRIMKKNVITNPKYLVGFEKVNSKFNALVSEKYYDLLFKNPKLMTDCSFQQKNKEIKLYPEQTFILQKIHEAIENDKPLLIGNEMPTGQGKSFLAVLLAKMFSLNKRRDAKKCVLFACPNELVNEDIASNTLIGNDIHLWMAKYILTDAHEVVEKATKVFKEKTIKVRKNVVLVRPYKRCFPSTWKKVYKDDTKTKTGDVVTQFEFYKKHTGKIPDIIVADLKSCEMLLQAQEKLGFPFVPYIDEFNTTEEDNKQIARICHYLPKQSVILSSILPKFDYIRSIVRNFCFRHKTTEEEACYRVCSADVSIPCVLVDKDGNARLPHFNVNNESDLEILIHEMQHNPRIRRMYSPKFVYNWAKSIESILPKELSFSCQLPEIGSVQLRNTIDYVILIMKYWLDNFDKTDLFMKYRPKMYDSVDIENIFSSESHIYDGRTLIVTENVNEQIARFSQKLYSDIDKKGNLSYPSSKLVKFDKLIQKRDKNIELYQKKMENLAKIGTGDSVKKKGQQKISKLDIMMRQDEFKNDNLLKIEVEVEPEFIINSPQHFKKFHPEKPTTDMKFKESNIFKDEYFTAFNDEHLYQMHSGIGTYLKKHQTEYQRDLVMKQYSFYSFFCSGIDVVYGTNLSGLVNIFIDKSFAEKNTVPTLYQCMGRAGRKGRSYHATIFVNDEETVNKLLSMNDNSEKENDIERFFNMPEIFDDEL